MVGSAAIAAFIAHSAFWVLLALGCVWQEIGRRTAGGFVLLWLAARLGLPYLPYGTAFFPPFVAALDVALVFVVFKGDVRLT